MLLNTQIIYRFIKYTLISIIIYFVLRYNPLFSIKPLNSLFVATALLLIYIIVEQLITYLLRKYYSYKHIDNSCKSCEIKPKLNEISVPNGSCRIVCDNYVENFDNNINGLSLNELIKKRDELQNKIENDKSNINSQMLKDLTDYNIKIGKLSNGNNDTTTKTNDIKNNTSSTRKDEKFIWSHRYTNLGYDNKHGYGGMFYDEYPFYNKFTSPDPSDRQFELDREKREQERVADYEKKLEDRAVNLAGYSSTFQEGGVHSELKKANLGKGFQDSRVIKGPLDDELSYTDYNHLPVGAGYKSHAYEYGYSFIPPEKWYPNPPRSPICVTERRCNVMPIYAQGTPVDVKEWHSSRRITQPDLISEKYIQDKLNSGR